MTYKQRYYDEIFKDALNDALKQELISHSEEFSKYIENRQDISNFYVMLLSIHSKVFDKVYSDMTEVYNSSKVTLATGDDLDDIGAIINCPRPEATKSGVTITFTLPKVYDHFIKESSGVEVTTPGGIVYRTEDPLVFPKGETVCKAYAYSVQAGTGYSVIENQLTKVNSKLSEIDSIKCTNEDPSSGGTDAYTDEEYRELLLNWVKSKQKGNYWAYVDFFARTDGIDGYKLIPNWDGSGTIKVVVDPGEAYLLNKIWEGLAKEATQISEDIYLTAPVKKSIDVYLTVNVDIDQINPYSTSEKDEIKGKIKQAVVDYFDSLKIGEDFIPHKCSVYIDKQVPELKDINFSYPTGVVTISDEEQCNLGNLEIVIE